MIISHLIGGLGNQMFQYALGRTLSLKHNEPLRLDLSGFAGYGLHQGYELERVFVCKPTIASEMEIRELIGWRANGIARKLLTRPAFRFLNNDHSVVEPHFHYWAGICDTPATAYLQGYWQSERYFADAAAVLRADFAFRQPLSAANATWADWISRCAAVSLHVRRGDYVSDPKTRAILSPCSLDYYRSAVRYIVERVETPEFFVFSDDINWARDNLAVDFPCYYIEHNRGVESYNDMRLMSLCQHHILANSSFSWWGAWLNPHADKIVVAPKRWFAGGERRVDDLIPKAWVTL